MLRLFGGIAEFPENADETSPRELSGHLGHQLDFRTPAIFNANDERCDPTDRNSSGGRGRPIDVTPRSPEKCASLVSHGTTSMKSSRLPGYSWSVNKHSDGQQVVN